MQKGWSKSFKASMLPLTRQALGYLIDAQEEEGRPGFCDYTDQYENRALTAISSQLGIETHLHHPPRRASSSPCVGRGSLRSCVVNR
ncbi:hypothetical protein [Hymenobacter bucti]|uniref:Uncharacterized protein n=1 Tax=Hymenobacter bucti TaxID=1844114 RepID=A0ABW4R2M5_9BACT